MKNTMIGILGVAALGVMASAASAATLDDVKAKGFVQCGVNAAGLAGFSAPDDKGEWKGLDVDYCRAVAAAIFGDGTKVKFTPLTAKDRFTALQSGEIDILSRNTTWTINRDTALGFNFAGITYYDGQGFMINAKKLPGVNSALQLSGASVCVQSGTTTELNLADYFKANNLEYSPVVFEKQEEVDAAYDAGRCDAYTTDQSGLYSIRLKLAAPGDHVVLPEIISKEPLGPVVRQGDDQWFNIAKWTYFALAQRRGARHDQGECRGNEDLAEPGNPARARRRGGSQDRHRPRPDQRLGRQHREGGGQLRRNLRSAMSVPAARSRFQRGINALWTKGGLQYAPPIR